MVDGVKSIHRAGIIHSDIKPLNVMIQDLGNNEFKANIIDLGSGVQAGHFQETQSVVLREYSILFASPEVLIDKTPEYKSDVWSLGAMFYFMISEMAPWDK
jgi:eukaryotic-like serine/threonine-protein kinase